MRRLLVTAVATTTLALWAAPARAQDLPPVLLPPVCSLSPGYNACVSPQVAVRDGEASAGANTSTGASTWGNLPRTLTYVVPYAAGNAGTETDASASTTGASADGSADALAGNGIDELASATATYSASAG